MKFIIIMNIEKYRKQNSLKFSVKTNSGPFFSLYRTIFSQSILKSIEKEDRKTQFTQVKQLKHFSHEMTLFTSILAS